MKLRQRRYINCTLSTDPTPSGSSAAVATTTQGALAALATLGYAMQPLRGKELKLLSRFRLVAFSESDYSGCALPKYGFDRLSWPTVVTGPWPG